MPYSTTVTFLDTEGASTPSTNVTARLWMLWTEVGGPTAVNKKQEEGSTSLDLNMGLSQPSDISFGLDASFSDIARGVGLSIQDTKLVDREMGWLFRSGRFDGSLPTEAIEILGARTVVPASEISSMLPALPAQVNGNTEITDFTAALAVGEAGPPLVPSGIDFTATGTTTRTGVKVGFRFTGRCTFVPSGNVARAETEALSVGIYQPKIVFISGPSVLSAIEAEILNLLRVFILKDTLETMRAKLQSKINSAVVAAAGRQLPGGQLPEGVLLSVRTVSVRGDASALDVRACLGAFGGVFSKLPPISASNIRCPAKTLVGLGLNALYLEYLREFRDSRLLGSSFGLWLRDAYYHHGAEIAELLITHRSLARRAADAIVDFTERLKVGESIPPAALIRYVSVLQEVASIGSQSLRATVARALEGDFSSVIA